LPVIIPNKTPIITEIIISININVLKYPYLLALRLHIRKSFNSLEIWENEKKLNKK